MEDQNLMICPCTCQSAEKTIAPGSQICLLAMTKLRHWLSSSDPAFPLQWTPLVLVQWWWWCCICQTFLNKQDFLKPWTIKWLIFCLADSNLGRYHSTILSCESTIVRGTEWVPNIRLGNLTWFLSCPPLTCFLLYSARSQRMYTI